MRITIVIAGLRGGGAERVAVNLANAWAGRGWRPTIITLAQKEEQPAYRLDRGVVHVDLTRQRFARQVAPELLDTIADVLSLCAPPVRAMLVPLTIEVALLREAIEASAPDAVLSFIELTNMKVIAATRRLGAPVYVYEQVDPRRTTIGQWEPVRRALYPLATQVVALTQRDADCFASRGANAVAIPNPVLRAPRLHPVAREPLIVAMGRLVAQKDFERLVQAFANLTKRHRRWRLEVWGEGRRRSSLEQLAADLGIADRVRFPGFAPDVYAVFGRAKIFAMTSTYEGFPNALCEAMASGVPAVAFNCASGIEEIVRDGVDGIVVRGSRSVGSFSEALGTLMSDEATRAAMARRAPDVAERFSMETILERWDALFAATTRAVA